MGKRRCNLFVIYSTMVSRKEKRPTVKERIVHFALQYVSRLLLCPAERSLDGHPRCVSLHFSSILPSWPTPPSNDVSCCFWISSASQPVQHQFYCLALVRTGHSKNRNGIFPCSVNSQKKIHCASEQAVERREIGQELTASKLVNTPRPTRIKLNLMKRPGITAYQSWAFFPH